MSTDEGANLVKLRAAASSAIVDSSSRKRLIVAGPGTGKSFTFKAALTRCGGRGLALTFIRNLVADLDADLGDVADVFTFHGYCKHLMHKHDVAGMQAGDYYPPLMKIVIDDLRVLTGQVVTDDEIDEHLHNLDNSDWVVAAVIERADYYTAVSHTDLVYRVLGHFEASRDAIPEYPLIVVDEYQDFSRLETSFIDLLATRSSVLIAGDDDQALYKKLKHASPEFIRDMAHEEDYDTFELPFCSRCTSVIVDAVNDLLAAAVAGGYLEGRLDKTFRCYLPDKGQDSDANPKIVHVKCSTANQPYAGRYIAQQVARIPPEDIAVSREKGYPTALVVGPNPFLRRAYDAVKEQFPQARMKTSTAVEIDALDGYRRIASDARSRLGWRIVMACCPFTGHRDALKQALDANTDLIDHLPDSYVGHHSALAGLVAIVLAGDELPDEDARRLVAATERSIEAITAFLLTSEAEDEEDSDGGEEQTPDILFTSLVGSKGLSAEHVFIVGLNNGHLPRDPEGISDDEICSLLVALSRTRKRCHAISCGFFGSGPLPESVFLSALRPHLDPITVNKDYDFSA
jgi:superfamily I DNA/RNA helicase